MTRAVIFDIDGTLSNPEHRLHFVRGPKKDWDSFFAGLSDDPPAKNILDLCQELSFGSKILVATGRPEKYRCATKRWLDSFGVYLDQLYIRPDDDTRPDHIVKSQILDGIYADGYEPWLVIDDRQSVVEMWRDRGLTCLQCRSDVPGKVRPGYTPSYAMNRIEEEV